MRNFSLFLDVKGDWILVSTSEEFLNPFSPYNENLDEKEHSQYSLSFSIPTKSIVDGVWNTNPLLSYYFLGARMYLILDNKKRVDLIISKVTPDSNELASILSIEAQDEISYKWSKRNLGMNYSTTVNGLIIPKNIFDIAKDVLERSFLDNEWSISSQSLDPQLETQPFTLELTNSNPYNILIEACNTINAYMDVDYNKKRLDFFRKDLVREFSGYRYMPSVNASDYNVDYSGEEMTTVLHVSGGEDAKGNLITMIPPMPKAVKNFLFINDWWDASWTTIKNNVKSSDESEILWKVKEKDKITYFSPPTLSVVSSTVSQVLATVEVSFSFNQNVISMIIGSTIAGQALLYKDSNWSSFTKDGHYYVYQVDSNTTLYMAVDIKRSEDVSTTIVNNLPVLYKQRKNNAFIDISNYQPDEGKVINFVYKVKYNDLDSKYYGHIEGEEQNGEVTTTVEYTFPINEKSEQPFGSSPIIEGECYKFKVRANDDSIDLFIYQKITDIQQAQQDFNKKQDKEIEQFFAIVEKIPYLGQSIFDFSPFYPYMSSTEKNILDNLINVEMRRANIKLQYYYDEYYNALYELNLLRQKFISYAELYGAACNNYQDAIKSAGGEANVTNPTELINEINKTSQDLKSVITSSKYFDLIDLLGQSKEINTTSYVEYFENLITQQKRNIEEYQKYKIGVISDSNGFEQQGETEYYTNLIKTANQLCYGFDYKNAENRGVYQLIIDYIKDNAPEDGKGKKIEAPPSTGIAYYLQEAQNDLNNRILPQLYYQFNLYIYEQNYDNPDELDSVALYNQAITHFADINRPQSNHSLEVLDIGELEQINIPRLSIGSMIQVYNKDSINAQPYLYILRQIEKYSALEQNAYMTNNSADKEDYKQKREDLEDELRAVYKENNNIATTENISINDIYNKIYYDSIFVTGISRVLREPLKDSVTVEQPSRYRTILSKLIKSI